MKMQISFILVLISLGTSTEASPYPTAKTKASLHLPHSAEVSSPSLTAKTIASLHFPHNADASSPSLTAKAKASLHLPHSAKASSPSPTAKTKVSLHLPHSAEASSPSPTAKTKASLHLPHSAEASSTSTGKSKTSIPLPLKHLRTQNYFSRPKTSAPHLKYPERYEDVAFVALIHFGSPIKPQYLHIDTGSTLTWIICFPRANCDWDSIYPRYRPQDSSTYYFAGYCESTPKGANPRFTYYYQTRKCTYAQIYADNKVIQGTLSRERLTMPTPDGGFDTLQGVYFGCKDHATGNDYIGNKILGLGSGDYSLVERLGSRFSICFGRMREPKDNHSLVLGDSAILIGTCTRITVTSRY